MTNNQLTAHALAASSKGVLVCNRSGVWVYLHPNRGLWVACLLNHPSEDLNALHAVWMMLTSTQREQFEQHLYDEVVGKAEFNRNDDQPLLSNATSRQRYNALLKTFDISEDL